MIKIVKVNTETTVDVELTKADIDTIREICLSGMASEAKGGKGAVRKEISVQLEITVAEARSILDHVASIADLNSIKYPYKVSL